MRRGTTPTIVFHLPFGVEEINNCEVYFSQNDELIIEKKFEDCVLDGSTLSVTLTQAETLAFSSDDNGRVEMQLRFVFVDGSVDATTITKEKAKKILKDGEIEARVIPEPEPTPEPEPEEPVEPEEPTEPTEPTDNGEEDNNGD